MLENLAKTYSPKDFEDRLYKFWNDNGYFKAEVDKSKKPFTIIMPPPNVTGNLHMGHALQSAFQDVLTRWKRMDGYSALWLPGTDHASISTESRVVNKIKSEGKSKEDLGRDGFLEEAWAWTEKYGGNIRNQMKKIGVSCDWSRDTFTLDEGPSLAVKEVFTSLYEKGLIYRGDRIINWCPNCMTAVSDAEVNHEEKNGNIWHIRYPIKDSGEFIVIATTRPETILGDLAIAVNPDDERYTNLVGKTAILPLMDREIPIISDDYVEMEFGTGAVKITPSHDPNDFEVGERHNLGQFIIMNEDASISENGGKYAGLDRYDARREIVKDLEDKGFLVEIKDHNNAVGHCDRCDTVIEPLISKQWFVKMEELAKPALEAAINDDLNFIPERFKSIYINWLENIKDWCISRQLWWGHRLPVYYCHDCGEINVSKEEISKCKKCESTNISQDEDTLDTWFSSALWPFSTLGWPNKTEDYDYFYPTDVLVTGYDIIFFWVIRMVFSALENTGKLPFKDVVLTGLIRDEQGRKMSKSLDNGIDPLDIIEEYGADALRFTLVTGSTPGNDMRFSKERVEANRNFVNKLWNASRFVLMNLESEVDIENINYASLEDEDRWILSKLNKAIEDMTHNLDKYELGLAAGRIYDFTWDEYCDWYIEMVKSRLYGQEGESKENAKKVLLYTLRNILKLLHPFMPFITEEIWQNLPGKKDPLILSSWPKYSEDLVFEKSEKDIEYIKTAIKGIRNARAEMNIVPSKKSKQIFVTRDSEIESTISLGERHFINLASAEGIELIKDKGQVEGDTISLVLDKAEVFLPLNELIDYEKELERLNKEREKLESEIKRVVGKLSNQGFISKAPESLVKEEEAKKVKFEEMLKNVLERIESVKANI